MNDWKPLAGHEDSYEVSSAGIVRRSMSRGKFHQRFTDSEIEQIKKEYAAQKSQRKVAAMFGVSQMTVNKIVRGLAYVDAGHILTPALRIV